jgi:hypothetical protein
MGKSTFLGQYYADNEHTTTTNKYLLTHKMSFAKATNINQ